MTDWNRVEKLRAKGVSWSEVAEDPKVGFAPTKGTDPGRSLKTLYFARRSRGKRPSDASSGDDSSPTTTTGSPASRRGIILALAAVALLVGGVTAYLVVYHPAPPGSDIVTYCGGEGTAAHYHPLLMISSNGAQQPLPYVRGQAGDIGFLNQPGYTNPSYYCPTGDFHALHTHDGSGIIHAELPTTVVNAGGTPTLGDFFRVWGEPLDSGHVWTFTGKVTATVLDRDNGQRTDYSSNPGSIPLYVPAAGPFGGVYPIPPQWIFNGQNGGGASNGYFSGEMIWFNVTSGTGMLQPITGGLTEGFGEHGGTIVPLAPGASDTARGSGNAPHSGLLASGVARPCDLAGPLLSLPSRFSG